MALVIKNREDRDVARKSGETKMRGIRVSDFDWQRFEEAAALSGESVSEYLRNLGRREADRRLGEPQWKKGKR